MDNGHTPPGSSTPDEASQATKRQALEQANTRLADLYGHSCALPDPASAPATVSTGLPPLDEALGMGGLPRGCLTMLLAHEPETAAAICLNAMAASQRQGGRTAYIGNSKRHKALAKTLGLNTKRLTLIDPPSAEGAFDICIGLLTQGYNFVALNLLDLTATATPSLSTPLETRLRRLAKLADELHNTLLLVHEPPKAASGQDAENAFRRAKITYDALEFYCAIGLRLDTLTAPSPSAKMTDMLMAAEETEHQSTATHCLTVTKNALGPAGKRLTLVFEPGQGLEHCALADRQEAPF